MSENKLFPGRPDYTGPTSGVFGLLHHAVICEISQNVMARVADVKCYKDPPEVRVRLHNMIYLGDCPGAEEFARRKVWSAPSDYSDAYEKILAYIKEHIPDCAWNESKGELEFPS
jgi:hypothetical protein